MLVGLSDTLSAGTRRGERKARLLLETLRNRSDDVLLPILFGNVDPLHWGGTGSARGAQHR
jgi:hypothetical protein